MAGGFRLDSESESTRFEVSVLELVEGHELVDLSLSSWSTRASKNASTVGSSC